MKSIQQAMAEEIYENAREISIKNQQKVGEKHDFYITLEQLGSILKIFES